MSFKDTYLQLWWLFYLVKLCHLCNFGREYYEEHFAKLFLKFEPQVQEAMLFKDISIFSSDGHFGQWSRTFCAILVEGIMRNISVKLF